MVTSSLQNAGERPDIEEVLATVPDPEVPVLSVLELGVIRRSELIDNVVHIDMTPTYSGCPALGRMQADIEVALQRAGYPQVEVQIVFAPAWTTDWMSDEAKEKLKSYGIAPPNRTCGDCLLAAPQDVVPCPRCDDTRTELRSQFGATACKALYYCVACDEPFEYFKAF